MKIVKKFDAAHVKKSEGTEVWYYLFPEYEVHYNEQVPGTTQTWHYHEKINETVFIIEGELVAKWKNGEEVREQTLHAGDLVQTENTNHTFENKSGKTVKFLILKQILTGEDRSELFKNDKIVTS